MSVHHLHQHRHAAPAYLNAAEKAAELGVSRDFVYRHVDELSGFRIGRLLRFPPGIPTETAPKDSPPVVPPAPLALRVVPPPAPHTGTVLKARPAQGRARRASSEAEAA